MITLGARMKQYELMTEVVIPKGFPVAIRIDGSSFSKWTKGLDKPFDGVLREAMSRTAVDICAKVPEVVWAYLQSDEVTFVVRSDLNYNSDPWHGFRAKKLDSLVASMFTAHFAQHAQDLELYTRGNHRPVDRGPAFFDARAYPLPPDEIINLMLWRQRDCQRNAVQAFGQHYIGKKAIHGWSASRVLTELGKIDKADLSYTDCYGTLIAIERGIVKSRPTRRWVITEAFPFRYNDETCLLPSAPIGHYKRLIETIQREFGAVAPILLPRDFVLGKIEEDSEEAP